MKDGAGFSRRSSVDVRADNGVHVRYFTNLLCVQYYADGIILFTWVLLFNSTHVLLGALRVFFVRCLLRVEMAGGP